MQHDIQPVIWGLINGESKLLEINEEGKKIIFGKEIIDASYQYEMFSLIDVINDIIYSIDLSNGDFIINGVPVCVSKEQNGRMISFTNLGLDYRKGLIQYKECIPMPLAPVPLPIRPLNFNIGYKIDTTDKNISYEADNYKATIIRVKAILSIDIRDFKPKISIGITERRRYNDGNVILVKV